MNGPPDIPSVEVHRSVAVVASTLLCTPPDNMGTAAIGGRPAAAHAMQPAVYGTCRRGQHAVSKGSKRTCTIQRRLKGQQTVDNLLVGTGA